ncbi:MAG: hypothetical protein ACM3PC_06810 [Deltaproteobacteria bacterium]
MHFRKFSPIDRGDPIHELLDGDVVLFDVSKSGNGKIEVAFHEGSRGRVLELDVLERLLGEGRNLAVMEER